MKCLFSWLLLVAELHTLSSVLHIEWSVNTALMAGLPFDIQLLEDCIQTEVALETAQALACLSFHGFSLKAGWA